MLRAATACLYHDCLLLTGCPACGGKLPVAAVVNATCPDCQTDLRRAKTTPLDEPSRLSQQTIQSWFGLAAAPNVVLPDLPPPALYRLLTDMVGFLERITSTASPYTYLTACQGLIDWPAGFYTFLDTYRELHRRLPVSSLGNEFGTLYKNGVKLNWRDFEPVQQAFDNYVILNCPNLSLLSQTHRFKANEQIIFINRAEATQRLNITRRMVEHLIGLGLIKRHPETSKGGSRTLLYRADVLALQTGWNASRPIADLARLLITDEAMVTALLTAGLLPEPTNAAACSLLDRLQVDLIARPPFKHDAVPLPDMPDPLVVIATVLTGQVRICFNGGLGLNRMRLARQDLIVAGLL